MTGFRSRVVLHPVFAALIVCPMSHAKEASDSASEATSTIRHEIGEQPMMVEIRNRSLSMPSL